VTQPREVDPRLARQLILDELFDLSLYESLRDAATGDLRSILDQLIPIEARHLASWQDFFERRVLTNLVIIAAAVGITFAIGVISKRVWGISV
jgi:hypothetical protein